MKRSGMGPIDDGSAGRIDLHPVEISTGFGAEFLTLIGHEFQTQCKCSLKEIATLDARRARLNLDQFKALWSCEAPATQRFFCHDGLLKRIFAVCDDDNAHKGEVSFPQVARGLKYFTEGHPTAYQDAKAGRKDFFDSITRLMDLEGTGTLSKLGMWALCDGLSKEDVYVFCDGVWEVSSQHNPRTHPCLSDPALLDAASPIVLCCAIPCWVDTTSTSTSSSQFLTGDSRSLSATVFTEKLQESLVMRQIFHRLMLLQCMKAGSDPKDESHTSWRQADIIKEVTTMAKGWMQKKRDGRFGRLDELLQVAFPRQPLFYPLFFCSSLSRRRQCPGTSLYFLYGAAGLDFSLSLSLQEFREALHAKDKDRLDGIIEYAMNFANSLRGQDSAKARHYVKLMIQTTKAKKWEYIETETSRLQEVLRLNRFSEDRTPEQIDHIDAWVTHLLRVLDAFRETVAPGAGYIYSAAKGARGTLPQLAPNLSVDNGLRALGPQLARCRH